MADDAAADRAGDAVVAGIVARDAADQRALEAALGLRGRDRSGSESQRQSDARRRWRIS